MYQCTVSKVFSFQLAKVIWNSWVCAHIGDWSLFKQNHNSRQSNKLYNENSFFFPFYLQKQSFFSFHWPSYFMKAVSQSNVRKLFWKLIYWNYFVKFSNRIIRNNHLSKLFRNKWEIAGGRSAFCSHGQVLLISWSKVDSLRILHM